MAEEFKRLSRDLVYRGSIIDYYKDTVQVPNGNIVKWDFIGHKGAAAIVAVRDDGKLLMVRQYRNALDRYTLEIPAGGLNGPDEPTRTAAARELEEETGFKTENMEYLMSVNTTVAFCDEAIDIFVARNLIPSHQHLDVADQLEKTGQNLDEDEFINVEAWDIGDLTEQIYNGTIQDSKTVCAIMAYYHKYIEA